MSATVETVDRDASAGYRLVGSLLESCECGVMCPCWVGEAPDAGRCNHYMGYHFDRGHVRGVDMTGLSVIRVGIIPRHALEEHSWQCVYLIDDRATPEQRQLLLEVFEGKLGGPLKMMADMVAEIRAVIDTPIEWDMVRGKGVINAPGILESRIESCKNGDGVTTALYNALFNDPGEPAWVSKTVHQKVSLPDQGLEWEFEGRNAIHTAFEMVA